MCLPQREIDFHPDVPRSTIPFVTVNWWDVKLLDHLTRGFQAMYPRSLEGVSRAQAETDGDSSTIYGNDSATALVGYRTG